MIDHGDDTVVNSGGENTHPLQTAFDAGKLVVLGPVGIGPDQSDRIPNMAVCPPKSVTLHFSLFSLSIPLSSLALRFG